MIELTPRRGMQESLEEYQARHPGNPGTRAAWRLEAIRLLGLDPANLVPDGRYQPRVCAQACPTNNGPTIFEEDEGPCYDETPSDYIYRADSLHVGATWNPFIKDLAL
jgi:hypothetical protein